MKTWDETFIEIAEKYAEHSSCAKYHVGAIITRDKRIISTGYNGVAAGQKHCSEVFKNIDFKKDKILSEKHHQWSLIHEIHAEVNAILFAARNGVSVADSTIYVTLQPCSQCCKSIISAGIKRVVFHTPYERDQASIKLLEDAGIEVIQV